jgi:thiol-disulfide isomerase/thioredoxin
MMVARVRLYWSLTLSILLVCIAFTPACTSREGNKTERTPVLSGPPSTTYPMPPLNGKSVSELGWELSDGQHNILSDYKGKVLVLDFYATWCEPCRQSVPHLIELQRRYENDGLRIVGLNVGGPEDQEKVSDFARELGIQYTLALPDDALISLLLSDSNSIPQTFIFDRNGELKKHFIGYGPATEDEIGRIVESALESPATQAN